MQVASAFLFPPNHHARWWSPGNHPIKLRMSWAPTAQGINGCAHAQNQVYSKTPTLLERAPWSERQSFQTRFLKVLKTLSYVIFPYLRFKV